MSAKVLATDGDEKKLSAHWSAQDSQREDVKAKLARSPLSKTGVNSSRRGASFLKVSAKVPWQKRMGALKPRARLYVLFACVQAVMLGSWLLASFAQAKGTLFAIYSVSDGLLLFVIPKYIAYIMSNLQTTAANCFYAFNVHCLLYTHLCARSGTL
jgi:hypothetical protein